jgi:hypothetical protein
MKALIGGRRSKNKQTNGKQLNGQQPAGKQQGIATASRLASASMQAVEFLENRVLMSSVTLAKWDFGTLPTSTSTTAIQTSPATTAGTGTAYTVGMQSGTTGGYLYPASGAVSAADKSTYLAATGTADNGGNGGSEDGTTGYVWRVESGQSDSSPIGSQGVQFNVSTASQVGTISVQWDMNTSSTGAEQQFMVEYTTNVTAASPTWTDVTQNLSFGTGDIPDVYDQNTPGNSTVAPGGTYEAAGNANPAYTATIGTSSTNDIQLLQNNNTTSATYADLVQPGTNTISNGSSSYTIVSANGDYAKINGPLVGGSNTAWLNGLSVTLPANATNAPGFAFRVVNAGTGAGETTLLGSSSATFKNYRFNDIRVLSTVNTPQQPIIESQPQSVTIENGATATFTAIAQTFDSTTATPPDANNTTVTWEVATPNGSGGFNTPQPISSDAAPADTASSVSYNSTNGYATASLTVPASVAKNGNEYLAVFTAPDAASPNTTTTSGAVLTVVDHATINSSPSSVTLPSGTENAVFTASASGLPGMTVQWYAEAPGTTTFTPISNGGVYSGATTNTLTLTDPTAPLGGYAYEAYYTDANGTVTTLPALLTITRASLADWQFNSVVTPTPGQEPYEPGPTTGSGTLTPLGQANNYNNGTSTDDEDVTNSPTAVAGDSFNEDTYRVRGLAGTGQQNNGWSNTAPEYSQGIELDVPVSGYDNFTASFDWYSTTQGVRDLQVQYFDPVTNAWTNYGSPYVASSDDFYGVTTNTVSGANSTGTPTPVFVDLRGVSDLSGISTLKLRMVSAYDPSLGLIDDGDQYDVNSQGNQDITHGQYASAAVYNVNEQQEFDFINAGGSLTLAYNGTTATTSYSYAQGSPSGLQTYLNSIPSISAAGGVTVLNNTSGYDVAGNYVDDYTVIFNDSKNVAEQPITIASSSGIQAVPLPTSTTSTASAGLYIAASSNGVVQYNNTSGNWRFDNMIVTGDATASAPTVTQQPVAQTFIPTTPAISFTAAATSSTATSVQWYVSSPNTAGEYGPFAAYNAGSVNTTNSGGTYTSTLTITSPSDLLNGDKFEAVFTNATGSNTSNVAPALNEEKIANWTFPTLTSAPDNSPLPTTNYLGAGSYELDNIGSGETSATLSTVGFNTPANGTTSGGPAADDIITTAGVAVPGYAENTLRVRNSTGGWDAGAPNDSEGVEVDFDGTGYSNFTFSADWYATNNSIRDLQEEYNLNPTNSSSDPNADAWVTYGSPIVATPGDFSGASTLVSHVPLDINLSTIIGASNDPSIGIRLVSSYDPAASTAEYTSASSTSSTIVPYSGTSGNWEFGDISIDAIPDWLAPTTANNTTWNPANNTLTAVGPATIISNPGGNTATSPTAEPNLVAASAASTLSFTPETNSGTPTGVGTDFYIGSLSLTNGASATVSSLGASRTTTNYDVLVLGTAGAATAPTFYIDPTSTLDLEDNDLIDLYGSGSDPYSTIQSNIDQAADGGAWNQTGLTSSVAKANASTYGLGYAEASSLPSPENTSFDGVTLGGNAVIVKYTLLGDTQLRGSVGIGDYDAVLSNYGNAEGWIGGDFHYGGVVGIGDYNDVLSNYGGSVATIATASSLSPSLATTRSVSLALASAAVTAPKPAKTDMELVVNTKTGDVYLQASKAVAFTGYSVSDPSGHLKIDLAKLLSVPASSGGNKNSYEGPSTSTDWFDIADTSSVVSEGQANNGFAKHATRDDTIDIPAGGKIDLGDIYNTKLNRMDLSFAFAEAATSGNPVQGPSFTGTVQYIGTATGAKAAVTKKA